MKTPDKPAAEKATAEKPTAEAPGQIVRAVDVPGYTVRVVDEGSRPRAVLAPEVGKALDGKAAYDAARAAIGDPDAKTLARLAMLFVDVGVAGMDPWTAAAPFGEPDQRAQAADPRREGEAVVYWRQDATTADLQRCTLAVEAGTVTCVSAPSLAREAAVEADPLAAAKADLTSENWSIRSRGLGLIAGSNDAAAQALLGETITDGEPAKMRQLAIDAAAKRSDGAASDAIAQALRSDPDAGVRRAAAMALRGDESEAARAALQHAAAHDADPTVKALATGFLRQ